MFLAESVDAFLRFHTFCWKIFAGGAGYAGAGYAGAAEYPARAYPASAYQARCKTLHVEIIYVLYNQSFYTANLPWEMANRTTNHC